MERISSRQNPLVRRFRELARAAVDDNVLLDGEHLLREALSSRIAIEVAAFSDGIIDESLKDEVARRGGRVVSVSAPVLAAMSPVRQPSGVTAIATIRRASLDSVLRSAPQLMFFLSDVQDPGNVGAIIRAADAFGTDAIVAGEGTADPYGWKALRGSMGSTFRVPVAARVPLADAAKTAKAHGIRLVAAVPREGEPLPHVDLRQPSAILLGSEGTGLRESLLRLADTRLAIPMRPPVESLNVAAAAALIAYEASRQKKEREKGKGTQ